MVAAGGLFNAAEEESAVVGEFLFGDGVGDNHHEPAGFTDFGDVGVGGQSGGDEGTPVVPEGLGGGRLADVEFVDEGGDEVAGGFSGSFDLTAGGHRGYAAKVADELFGEFAEMGVSRFSHE